jgi:hypothetical protein
LNKHRFMPSEMIRWQVRGSELSKTPGSV